MKKLFVCITFMAVFVALCGCGGSNNGKSFEKEKKTLNQAIEEAEKKPRLETNVFLGFKIGMTKKEYEKHYAELLEQGKITEVDGKPQYNITTKDGWEGTLTFAAKTYKDSLYSITFLILDEDLENAAHLHLLSSFKASEKSSEYEHYTENSEYNNTPIETYIKDNLVIQFGLNRVTYYDAPTKAIEKQLEKYDEEIKAAEKKKRGDASVDDF